MRNLFLAILMLSFLAQPCLASQLKREVKKGNMLYKKAEYDKALDQYEEALIEAPDSDVVNFNIGTALYKTGDYEAAITHFQKSLVSEDKSLEQKAHYNLGNTKFQYGLNMEDQSLPAAVDLLEQSHRHYERALELYPDDKDAKYNYEVAERELERLKEKLKKQKMPSWQQNEDNTGKEDKYQEQDNKEEKAEKQAEVDEALKEPEGEREEEEEWEKEAGSGEEEKSEGENESEQPASRGQAGDISEKEARMILENYREEDEPKGLYTEKLPKGRPQKVLKDW